MSWMVELWFPAPAHAGDTRLVFLSGSNLELVKVGSDQGFGESLTNGLLLLSDKAVPVEW